MPEKMIIPFTYKKKVIRSLLLMEILGFIMTIASVVQIFLARQEGNPNVMLRAFVMIILSQIVIFVSYRALVRAAKNVILLDTEKSVLTIFKDEQLVMFPLEFVKVQVDKDILRVIDKKTGAEIFSDKVCDFDLRGFAEELESMK